MADRLREIQERATFQGAAQSQGFSAINVPDQSQQIYANLNTASKNYDRSMSAFEREAADREKNLKDLSSFSETLTNFMVEGVKIKNQADFEQAQLDYFDKGYPAEKQAEYDAQVNDLKVTDSQIQKAADDFKKAGTPYDAVHMIRNSSGWYKYGLEVAHAGATGDEYPAWLQNALTSDNETEVTYGGRTFKVNEANGSGEKLAAVYVLRSQYMRERGLMGLHPGLLNKHVNGRMREAEQQVMSEVRRKEQQDFNDERSTAAINGLTVGLNAGSIESFGDAVNDLRRYMSAKEARKMAMDHMFAMQRAGKLSAKTIQDVMNSPFAPTGMSWGDSFTAEWVNAEERSVQAQQARYQLQTTQLETEAKTKELEVLSQMQGGNYSDEQLQELIAKLEGDYSHVGYKATDLRNYLENHTVNAKDRVQQRKQLDALFEIGALDSAELMSGKYDRTLMQEYSDKAQLTDKQKAAGGKVSKHNIDAVKAELRARVSVYDDDSSVHSSVHLALNFAEQDVERKARNLIMSGQVNSWDMAYSQAALQVIEEIKKSPRYKVEGIGPKARFTVFADPKTAMKLGANAEQELRRVRSYAKPGSNALATNANDIFSKAELDALSNPNNRGTSAHMKLREVVAQHNRANPGAPLDYATALNTVMSSTGRTISRPFKSDPYENLASTAGLMSILTNPTPSSVNRLAAQGGLVPPTIRKGEAGGLDVMRAAQAYGLPPQVAPLAAAVWALESGWGKSTSGNNNYFGIKGKGTTITTMEYSGVPTVAQFKNYSSSLESVNDFVQLLKDPRYKNVLTAKTPMQALKELKKAGYATDPEYVSKAVGTLNVMGIDANKPYVNQNLTSSPWSNPALMGSAARSFITGGTGIGTGPHLDMRVKNPKTGEFVNPTGYVNYLTVDGKPITSQYKITSGYGPRRAPVPGASTFHNGIDFGTPTGTRVSVAGGRYSRTFVDSGGGGVVSTYILPDGMEMRLLHGSYENVN